MARMVSSAVAMSGSPIERTPDGGGAASAGHAGLGPQMEANACATIISAPSTRARAYTASCYSYRTNYLDLDPTYQDRFGVRCCA